MSSESPAASTIEEVMSSGPKSNTATAGKSTYFGSDSLVTPTIEEVIPSDSEPPAMPTAEGAPPPTQPKKLIPEHEFEGQKDGVLVFVFLHDNVHNVSGSLDGTMRKWDCDTGLPVGEPWIGEGGEIHTLALSPDGKTIACGRGDGSIQRWNNGGEMIGARGIWTGHDDVVLSMSWSPRGDHIAIGSRDGEILIERAESGETEVGPIEVEQRRVYALAYAPSGDRIASGGWNTICIWDTRTGELILGSVVIGLVVGQYKTLLCLG